MKLRLVVIAILGMALGTYGQNSRIILDGYTSAQIGDFDYHQSGMRILVSIPTKVEWLRIASEAFVLDQGFGQSLVGTEFKLSKSLFVSTLIGIANTPVNPLRLGTSAVFINQKMDGLFVFQWGPASDYFYITKWAFKIKNVGLGARSQRLLNTGVYLDYYFNKNIKVWTQVGKAIEFDHNSIALGITGTF